MVFNPSPPFGSWFTPTGGVPQMPSYVAPGPQPKTPEQTMQEWLAARAAFNASPIGQDYNAAQKSAAAQARKQADFDMDQAKRKLDEEVANLRRQGRISEADLKLRQGEAEIAKQRFAWEQQVKSIEMGQSQQGLDQQRADLWAKYSSRPDLYWSQREFRNALSRVAAGGGPQPVAQSVADFGAPQPATMSEFDAIAGPGGSLAVGQQPSPPMPGAPTVTGTSGGGGSTTNAADPRGTAASAVLKALTPSEDSGLDENDVAAINAIYNIYSARKPGTLQRLGAARTAIADAGLARAGFDPALLKEDIVRSGLGMGSVRAA